MKRRRRRRERDITKQPILFHFILFYFVFELSCFTQVIPVNISGEGVNDNKGEAAAVTVVQKRILSFFNLVDDEAAHSLLPVP